MISMKRSLGILFAVALVGCNNGPLAEAESQQRDFIQLACGCDWEAGGYSSEAECVSEESMDIGFDDCERQAYESVPGINAYLDCAVAANRTLLDCTRAAACDEAAEAACFEANSADLEACPEVTEADDARLGELLRECRAGPPGTCPDSTISGEGAIATGSTMGAGADLTSTCGGENAPDVAFEWTAPSAGTWTFDTYGSDFDTVLYALTSCGGEELACNDDGPEGFQSELTLELTAGQTIVLVVDGFDTDAGNFVLNATAL